MGNSSAFGRVGTTPSKSEKVNAPSTPLPVNGMRGTIKRAASMVLSFTAVGQLVSALRDLAIEISLFRGPA